MAKYAVFFTFKGETIARFIEQPSDRVAAVGRLAEAANARLDAYYWMFGEHDGFAIIDAPDSASMAALSLAVSSSGAFAHLETHELIEARDLATLMARAKEVGQSYSPPGD